jgi:hypothetical protein
VGVGVGFAAISSPLRHPRSRCTTHDSLSHCWTSSSMGCLAALLHREAARHRHFVREFERPWPGPEHRITGEALASIACALGIVVVVRIRQKGCELADMHINVVMATASIIVLIVHLRIFSQHRCVLE